MRKWGNRISGIYSVDADSLTVGLKFQDGSRGMVSLRDIFESPKGLAAEILMGGVFDKCFVELGALAWPNGYELCPDALKDWLVSQKRHEKSKAA